MIAQDRNLRPDALPVTGMVAITLRFAFYHFDSYRSVTNIGAGLLLLALRQAVCVAAQAASAEGVTEACVEDHLMSRLNGCWRPCSRSS
ncbi:hypothetical protein BURKHO8Y_480109 [Burkholderia sp. 8Y]|nr:hypothetical protein BURKHO8Y_480109 [Burkholderia sp. 8Y]